MEITRYIVVPGILLIIGLLSTVIYYYFNRKSYLQNRVLLRKIYYFVVILTGLILVGLEKFPFTTTAELVGFVVGVIVIDLMVFQTPDITKFMSHELKQEQLAETIEKNEGSIQVLTEKILCVNKVMPKASQPWEVDSFDFSYDAYEEYLLSYLRAYTNQFNINIFSYYVESSPDEAVFVKNVRSAYDKIKKDHDFSVRGIGMRRKRLLKILTDGGNVEVFEHGRPYVIFSYFGEYYNFIFVITSKDDSHVGGVDASLLLNMMYMLDYWLLSNEHDLVDNPDEEDDFDWNTDIEEGGDVPTETVENEDEV